MKDKTPANETLANETARFHALATQSLEWIWETDAQRMRQAKSSPW